MQLFGTYKFSEKRGAEDVAEQLGLGRTSHVVTDNEGSWFSPGSSDEQLQKRLRVSAIREFVESFSHERRKA